MEVAGCDTAFKILSVALALSIFISISNVMAMPPGGAITPARAIEVSVIKGEQLTPLLNNKAENYSVMSGNGPVVTERRW